MVSREVANNMTSFKSGQIINISSIAGTQVYANGNVYCASKHAVDALTKAMRVDFLPFGIRVSSVSPGAVETEFSMVRFKGDSERSQQVYKGYQPLLPEDIASSILHIVQSPAHVNINDIEITPTAQANAYYLHKNQ
jgi:NADP-dependent 3-hydroxy acid dehydrogenase YdfG